MEHILDNPIYNAALSANRHLSAGTDSVRYFLRTVAPFAGLREWEEGSFALLADMLPPKAVVVAITAANITIPCSWKIIRQGILFQMIGEHLSQSVDIPDEIRPLRIENIPQMLELTKLTEPGPFGERTIEFGNYNGIFNYGQLVAMAGYRLHAGPYIEVSAVCTHPDHVGKGYGRALTTHQAQQIVQQGNIPFLHVRADNERAIGVYEKAGFVTRCEMHMNVIRNDK
jgi:predicted GNAT family acetyltransferase